LELKLKFLGVFHYVSEDTHWVPFINATINYINRTYKKPYNEDALRLITFLLGFTSHQIADVNWHSLDVEQGFLSAMGFVNFHGSFPDAHLVGDTGSDVINQFELNTKYIADLGDWFIPYKDLYNIYIDYYGKEIVTEADIIECSSILFLGR
jgi:glycosylphosphatidylinositol phospholipase D